MNLKYQEINVFRTMGFHIYKKNIPYIEKESAVTPRKHDSGYFWVLILQMVFSVFQFFKNN